jgi:hypothetical protein
MSTFGDSLNEESHDIDNISCIILSPVIEGFFIDKAHKTTIRMG